MLLSLIRMIQAFRDYQRNVSELSQLSDRELADIGLDRRMDQLEQEITLRQAVKRHRAR